MRASKFSKKHGQEHNNIAQHNQNTEHVGEKRSVAGELCVSKCDHGSLEWDEARRGGISRLRVRFLTMSLSFSLYGPPRITTH